MEMVPPNEEGDLWLALGRIEGKLDLVVNALDVQIPDLVKRVGALERWRSWVQGWWAALAVLGGLVGAALVVAVNWLLSNAG